MAAAPVHKHAGVRLWLSPHKAKAQVNGGIEFVISVTSS